MTTIYKTWPNDGERYVINEYGPVKQSNGAIAMQGVGVRVADGFLVMNRKWPVGKGWKQVNPSMPLDKQYGLNFKAVIVRTRKPLAFELDAAMGVLGIDVATWKKIPAMVEYQVRDWATPDPDWLYTKQEPVAIGERVFLASDFTQSTKRGVPPVATDHHVQSFGRIGISQYTEPYVLLSIEMEY